MIIEQSTLAAEEWFWECDDEIDTEDDVVAELCEYADEVNALIPPAHLFINMPLGCEKLPGIEGNQPMKVKELQNIRQADWPEVQLVCANHLQDSFLFLYNE